MDQLIAFQAPDNVEPRQVPVSAANPLPVAFVDAPIGTPPRAGVRSQVIAIRGADGQPRQVVVSAANPLPIVIIS